MSKGVECRKAQYTTCERESNCTGMHAECPRSPPMPDGTDCQERGKCRAGKCTPYCETQGLQSCMCDISMIYCTVLFLLLYKLSLQLKMLANVVVGQA